MTYKEEKEHTLKLNINTSKGSRVQNKKFDLPVKYVFPTQAEGGEDKLLGDKGKYTIVTEINGADVEIGTGGDVTDNGKVTITDKNALLTATQQLPNGNQVTQLNLDSAMANGGTDDLKRNGNEKMVANLSATNQQKLSAEITPEQSAAAGLPLVADDAGDANDGGGSLPLDQPGPTEAPDAGDANDGGGSLPLDQPEQSPPQPSSNSSNASTGGIRFTSKSQQFGSALVFPENMLNLDQDYIKFRTYRYIPQTFKKSSFGFTGGELGSPEGTCYLPVSNGPKDANGVSWGENKVTPLQAIAYEAAYDLIVGDQSTDGVLKKARSTFMGKGEEAKKFVAMSMASQAAQVQGMLSRTSGAVLNPNMVLLFSNPELRKFTFTFQLRPRNTAEASTVRQIIRMFKQSMSVRKEDTNLFLLAPNVYAVSYHRGGSSGEDHSHKAIGRVKTCALTNCSIDYAPDGSYMTFGDSAATMTAYSMSLQFSELEPVYYD